jgi:hypothetical protein
VGRLSNRLPLGGERELFPPTERDTGEAEAADHQGPGGRFGNASDSDVEGAGAHHIGAVGVGASELGGLGPIGRRRVDRRLLLLKSAARAIGGVGVTRAAAHDAVHELGAETGRHEGIVRGPEDPVGTRVHAHIVVAVAVRAGAETEAQLIASIGREGVEGQLIDGDLLALPVDAKAEKHPIPELVGVGGTENGARVHLAHPGREAGHDDLIRLDRALLMIVARVAGIAPADRAVVNGPGRIGDVGRIGRRTEGVGRHRRIDVDHRGMRRSGHGQGSRTGREHHLVRVQKKSSRNARVYRTVRFTVARNPRYVRAFGYGESRAAL